MALVVDFNFATSNSNFQHNTFASIHSSFIQSLSTIAHHNMAQVDGLRQNRELAAAHALALASASRRRICENDWRAEKPEGWDQTGNLLPPVTCVGPPTSPAMFKFYRRHYQSRELQR